MTKKSMRKGFTLVELLVVIIIIGILAAAALLASGSATDSAQASTIVSDMRSLKSAVLLYVADHVGDDAATIATALDGDNGIPALKPYMDDDADDGKFGTNTEYVVKAVGNNVYVGYGKTATTITSGVKGKLVNMAAKVGLKKIASDTVSQFDSSATTVYMIAR